MIRLIWLLQLERHHASVLVERALAPDWVLELCVRHLLRGEDIGEFKAIREESIEEFRVNSIGKGLAQQFGLTKPAINKRIKRFLLLLPTDGRGGKLLTRRAEALLTAAKNIGYQL